ncbi:antirestriction protein ArdA [Roseobacter sp. S98]|uniref:antirestriction protein ArdA n=1 Tax=Roseobacter algicola (ex Choi et al. 2025) (nom. illeg.) TaxID=3092138 RepID=UPI0035C71FE5
MPTFYAQPYNISATGFYFDTAGDFADKAKDLCNAHGDPVEEFEIQFIHGDELDCALARAIGLSQSTHAGYFDACEIWEDWQKVFAIIALGECGYAFEPDKDPTDYDIDFYHADSLRDFAEQMVEDGLLGDVPENIRPYFDYDAFARDLGHEYSEITIAGERYVWRAG